jgi:hypothetical protein
MSTREELDEFGKMILTGVKHNVTGIEFRQKLVRH